jgi:Cu-Zn family superoxide dismutase
VRHIGDFGNINCDSRGVCSATFNAPTVKLSGKFSVLGRTIVLHQNKDDLGRGGNKKSLEVGNSGARIACGIIGVDKP